MDSALARESAQTNLPKSVGHLSQTTPKSGLNGGFPYTGAFWKSHHRHHRRSCDSMIPPFEVTEHVGDVVQRVPEAT